MATTGFIRELKDKINYQGDLPRCGVCKHVKIKGSEGKRKKFCTLYEFSCGSNALCDDFVDNGKKRF